MIRRLSRDRKGVTLVEFALLTPVLFTFLIAIIQFGTLYFAQAGLKHAVAEGARLASIFPRPSRTRIIAKIAEGRFGVDPARITNPTVTPGEADGRDFLDISLSYEVQMDFIFFSWPTITLTENRRVFVHPI